MKKILISPDFLYQISLYLLLPNLATTKFLILKQAKKLVMRMNTRKLAPGKRNIAGARDRSTFHRNARYLTSSSRRWPKFWISMSAGCSARFEISKEKITCYSSEPAETISGSLFLSEGNLRWKIFMFHRKSSSNYRNRYRISFGIRWTITTVFAANGRSVCVSSRESRLQSLSCPFSLNSRCLRIVIRRQGGRVVMMPAEEEAEFEQDINWLALTLWLAPIRKTHCQRGL